MKRFSRYIALILVLSTLLAIPALASENPTPRASSYFGYASVYLWKTSSSSFQIWFDVAALDIMDKLGVSKIVLQRSSDNENWTDIRTYNMADYPQMVASNTGQHSGYVTYSSYNSSYYYRAKATLYAKKGSGTAEYTVYGYFAN